MASSHSSIVVVFEIQASICDCRFPPEELIFVPSPCQAGLGDGEI